MKKLIIALGCVSAVLLISSCTTDSVEEIDNTNSKNNPKNSLNSTTAPLDVPSSILMDIGNDDKDKQKT
jgi:hypothetical protein